ncbi:MAG: hypothetical protein R2711_16465 [Acidimicrobiales bacterium]
MADLAEALAAVDGIAEARLPWPATSTWSGSCASPATSSSPRS